MGNKPLLTHKKLQIQITFQLRERFFTVKLSESVFDSKIKLFDHLSIRGYSWHKHEIKRIQRCHYSSIDNLDTKRQNKTESKRTRVVSQKALFFNAFKLGLLILKDAHIGIESEVKESIKKQI